MGTKGVFGKKDGDFACVVTASRDKRSTNTAGTLDFYFVHFDKDSSHMSVAWKQEIPVVFTVPCSRMIFSVWRYVAGCRWSQRPYMISLSENCLRSNAIGINIAVVLSSHLTF